MCHIARCIGKELYEVIHIIYGHALIQRDTDPTLLIVVEVDTQLLCCFVHCLYPTLVANLQRIKELGVLLLIAVCLEHLAQIDRLAMDTLGYLTNTLCAVINAIHTCHHSRERLCGTDVGCRFLAFDMLLTCLERQAECWFLVGVLAESNDTTRHIAFVLLAGSHIASGRTTKAHRQAKALRRTAHDVCVQRFEQCQCHEVSNHGHLQASSMAVVDKSSIILYRTICIRTLHNSTEEWSMLCEPIAGHARIIHHHEFYVLTLRTRLHNVQGVGKYLLVHQHFLHTGFDHIAGAEIAHHGHSFCSSCRLIKQRAVGEWQTRQVANHSLIHKECLQATLTHFCLVRGI